MAGLLRHRIGVDYLPNGCHRSPTRRRSCIDLTGAKIVETGVDRDAGHEHVDFQIFDIGRLTHDVLTGRDYPRPASRPAIAAPQALIAVTAAQIMDTGLSIAMRIPVPPDAVCSLRLRESRSR